MSHRARRYRDPITGTPLPATAEPAFARVTAEALRAAGHLKWTLFGPGRIGAFVAEMDFGTAPEVAVALHDAVERAQFGYLSPAWVEELTAACAQWQQRAHGWAVEPALVRLVPDVLAAFEVAIAHWSAPASPVILPVPSYMPFLSIPATLGRPTIPVDMVRDGGRWRLDLESLDRALRAGGDLVVLCNPHNPLGRVMELDELVAVSELVERHGGHVFSDEIHAPLVYRGHRHVPYASVSSAAAAHSVTATSASKAWNLPGLKSAQVILGDETAAERWDEAAGSLAHGPSTLGVLASTVAFDRGGPWLGEVMGYLDANRARLGDLLAEAMPDVAYDPPEGTYLAWLDCRRLGLGAPPGAFFAEHAAVDLVEGTRCGEVGAGYVRLNFATSAGLIDEMVERMASAVRDHR